MKPEIRQTLTESRGARDFLLTKGAFLVGFINGAFLGNEFVKQKYGSARFSRRAFFMNIVAPALAGGVIGTIDSPLGLVGDLIIQSNPPNKR